MAIQTLDSRKHRQLQRKNQFFDGHQTDSHMAKSDNGHRRRSLQWWAAFDVYANAKLVLMKEI